MKNVAKIQFDGGCLLVPATATYDREWVFEHAARIAHRYGRARLELDHEEWTVIPRSNVAPTGCSTCGRDTGSTVYRGLGGDLCGGCMKNWIGRRAGKSRLFPWRLRVDRTAAPAA